MGGEAAAQGGEGMTVALEEKRKIVTEIHGDMEDGRDLGRVLDEKGVGRVKYKNYLQDVSEADESDIAKAVKPEDNVQLTIMVNKTDYNTIVGVAKVYCFSKEDAAQMLLHDGIINCLNGRDNPEGKA